MIPIYKPYISKFNHLFNDKNYLSNLKKPFFQNIK